jgi:hypothetical protein
MSRAAEHACIWDFDRRLVSDMERWRTRIMELWNIRVGQIDQVIRCLFSSADAGSQRVREESAEVSAVTRP